jgi:hypothetical protein
MLYKTVLTQKPLTSDENYFHGSGIYQLTSRDSGWEIDGKFWNKLQRTFEFT